MYWLALKLFSDCYCTSLVLLCVVADSIRVLNRYSVFWYSDIELMICDKKTSTMGSPVPMRFYAAAVIAAVAIS